MRFGDEYGYYCVGVNYCDAMTPVTFQEALTWNTEKWQSAMNRVYKLNKALYGLKESPRPWYKLFNNFITLGFRRSKFNCCLYVKQENNLKMYILLFVDDLLICC